MSDIIECIVSEKQFKNGWSKYVAQSRAGKGPIGITDGKKVIGVFVSVEDYEAAYGAAIRRMLSERIRQGGPTLSSAEVLADVKERLRRRAKRQ